MRINNLQKQNTVIACLGLKQSIWIARKDNKCCSRGQATVKLGAAANVAGTFQPQKPELNT